ncbi:MAG: hypothetical protein MUF25_15435, partial [Pirellulaceae bacterium]|nr:hypothetical protein [Pirellulaceae bacterium]
LEVTPVRTAICLGMVPLLFGWTGCRQATPVVPGTETYSVEANQSELVAGEKRNVEILVRYHRSDRSAALLKYTVQLSAPRALTITRGVSDVLSTYAGSAYVVMALDACGEIP